jgi:hypothetical protein
MLVIKPADMLENINNHWRSVVINDEIGKCAPVEIKYATELARLENAIDGFFLPSR